MDSFRHWLAQPQYLWLWFLFPLVGIIGAVARYRQARALARLGSRSAVSGMLSVRKWIRFFKRFLFSLGMLALIIGIAGPQWGIDPTASFTRGRDLVVVLDCSRSMLSDDTYPNRLDRARSAIFDLVNTVQKRGGHRIALVAFGARAKVLCPLTHDYDHFREALAFLDPNDPLLGPDPANRDVRSGTRIGAGLKTAVNLHPNFQQDIILISDGDDPANDREWRAGAVEAQEHGIPVYTVGIGDPNEGGRIPLGGDIGGYYKHNGIEVRTRLHEQILEEIAKTTGGVYLPARTKAFELGKIFTNYVQNRATRDEDTATERLPVYQKRFAWFLGPALLFLVWGSMLSDRRRPKKSKKKTEQKLPTALIRSGIVDGKHQHPVH